MLRRVVWVMVGLTALYVVMLMLTTPTPSKDETGILNRLLPTAWFS
ncbi:hypothetical protein OLX23_00195 [Novosphingobium sp. JCM 18896]|nr:hypothetical protein [Novosphingobium sp. JCM 18896]